MNSSEFGGAGKTRTGGPVHHRSVSADLGGLCCPQVAPGRL